MEKTPPTEAVCEVCAKSVARRDDLLCDDCSRAFTLMLELLHGHPDVDVADVDRIKEVYEWRMRKKGLLPAKPEVEDEKRILTEALALLSRKQNDTAQQQEAVSAPTE
jgi:hypothetical protein